MDRTLQGMIYFKCHIGDIIMWRKNVELHMGHLRAVLGNLDNKGLRVHSEKCVFGKKSIGFLGYKWLRG